MYTGDGFASRVYSPNILFLIGITLNKTFFYLNLPFSMSMFNLFLKSMFPVPRDLMKVRYFLWMFVVFVVGGGLFF